MSKSPKGAVNYGIQGDVKAGAVAVGDGAQAFATGGGQVDSEALAAALQEMRLAIGALQLSAPAREAIHADVEQLEDAVRAPRRDGDRIGEILSRLATSLSKVGIVLTNGVAVVEAIKKFGAMIPLSLKSLGLGP